MAAPGKIAKLDPLDSLPSAMRKILRSRLRDLFTHQTGVLTKGTVDPVHDARVAIRRLEGLFDAFDETLPDRRLRRYQKMLRKSLRSLGAVRELDVMIETIDAYRATLPEPEQMPMLLLEARLQLRRRTALPAARGALRTMRQKGIFDEMLDKLTPLPHPNEASAIETLAAMFHRRLPESLQEILDQGLEVVDASNEPEKLHEFRIAMKPHRYLFELAAQVFPQQLNGMYKEVKALVESLGAIHDGDVMIPALREHLDELRTFNRIAPAGRRMTTGPSIRFIAILEERRRRGVEECRALLGRWSEDEYPAKLRAALAHIETTCD
jgi:triphosphatase